MKAAQRPKELCRCGSGFRFGQCHGPIFAASPETMIAVAQKTYADQWTGNATSYESQGVYTALADILAKRAYGGRILDIGSGLGHGLVALRDRLAPITLFGMDENPECLAAAAEKLGLDPSASDLHRMSNQLLPNKRYRSSYDKGALQEGSALRLVQSDILVKDPAFSSLLDSLGEFDAITLWFSGVHKARSATELASFFEITSDADHREVVEDATTSLGQQKLRSGGWLHMAIRGGFPNATVAVQATREPFEAMIDGKGFDIREIAALPYLEPTGTTGMTVRSKDEAVNKLPSFAVSILMQKVWSSIA